MSFESCIREQADVLTARLEQDIEDSRVITSVGPPAVSGGEPVRTFGEPTAPVWKQEFVDNIDCALDFIFILEPFWGEIFASSLGFRDARRMLRVFIKRLENVFAFAQRVERRRLTLQTNVDAFKAFIKRFEDLQEQFEDCPPVKNLIVFVTAIQAAQTGLALYENIKFTFSESNLQSVAKRELTNLARGVAADILSEGIEPGNETTLLLLIAPIVAIMWGGPLPPNPDAWKDLILGAVLLTIYLTTVVDPVDEEGNVTIGESLENSIVFLRMIEDCLDVSGIDFSSPEVQDMLTSAEEGNEDAKRTLETFGFLFNKVPRPDGSDIANLPPL